MNKILPNIKEPRWHDRVVLIADRNITALNEIEIDHHDFPVPFFFTGEFARSFPLEQMKTKDGGTIAVRAVPIAELEKEILPI